MSLLANLLTDREKPAVRALKLLNDDCLCVLQVNDDTTSEAYAYRFIHGIKFFSMYGVVLGHAYGVFDFTVICKSSLNA